jgi:hypothetical protein
VFPKEPPAFHAPSASKVPALAGAQSYADFATGSKNVDVRRSSEDYALWKNVLRKGDFWGTVAERRSLTANHAELAEWILSWLSR